MPLHHKDPHDLASGWARDASPFHDGERAVQRRKGVDAQMERFGRMMIRDWIPDQHRIFYASLPYIVVGSVDDAGRPWASFVADEPGFVSSPDEYTLRLALEPTPGDPLAENLRAGRPLGLLGINLGERRRNRVHGLVSSMHEGVATIDVAQAFGNCPQYIQVRSMHTVPERTPGAPIELERLDERARRLIERADTFFIATTQGQPTDSAHAERGVDVSHRGGKPGFVKLEGDELVWPDFSGNNHFNTLGNLVVHPRAGYVFVDFSTGDALHVTGDTEIVWEGPEVDAFEGAQQLVRTRPTRMVFIPAAIPLAFDLEEVSPYLELTGRWPTQPGDVAFTVSSIVEESERVRSLYLTPADGSAPPEFDPGQHVELVLPVGARRYSLSGPRGQRFLRISVERHERGAGSGWLHDDATVGDTLDLSAPTGDFTLKDSSAPVVMLAGGIGITPLLAMLHDMARRGDRRPVALIWSVRRREDVIFGSELGALHRVLGGRLTMHVQVSSDEGRLTPDALADIWPHDAPDVYICGSLGFELGMRDLIADLPVAALHAETFGGALPVRDDEGPRPVAFRASEVDATWTGGSLLDLAHHHGIEVPFSCRAGSCGSCISRICSGSVSYDAPPYFETDDEHALLCVAKPGEDGVSIDV